MKELEYPFDAKLILRKRKALKRTLLEQKHLIDKKVAVLGGSTTHDIIEVLELFLLQQGIRPIFYESEYARYWEDVAFENPQLFNMAPDIVFIHTSNRNIKKWPSIENTREEVNDLLEEQFQQLFVIWEKIREKLCCPIIQNNYENPYYRTMGNAEASDYRGKINFISRLNIKIYEYAQEHSDFFVNDIQYQSSDYGLKEWSDPFFWHMYKYSLNINAIPLLAYNVSNIIKSIYGKNKKAIALDLDNTLWGGVVGDDGAENLVIGQEISIGQAYSEFQTYLKRLKEQGVILNIISKNEHENALAGIHHPQMILREEDFVQIVANWEPKSTNLKLIADNLSLLPEAFVFADDNPAEREIVRQQVPGVGIPELRNVEHYIYDIDRAGYFEVTTLSEDDIKRSKMYKENIKRIELQRSYDNYSDYLLSLNMKAEIQPFAPVYLARIAQLTNKSNQFNLTTQRFTKEDIEQIALDERFITLYGKLEDCFGDNGVVALVIGEISKDSLDIILWLMSCRVLKRDMEFAMMDTLVEVCKGRGITTLIGHYFPSSKNAMVKEFYATQGFTKRSEDNEGNTKWILDITQGYEKKNHVIKVNGGKV